MRFLDIWHAAETGEGIDRLKQLNCKLCERIILRIPDEILCKNPTVQALFAPIKLNARDDCGGDSRSQNAMRKIANNVVDSLFNDDDDDVDVPYMSDPECIWRYIRMGKWREVLAIISSDYEITRVVDHESVIKTICGSYPRGRRGRTRVLTHILRRWPVLTETELVCWFQSLKHYECELIYQLAPIQPNLLPRAAERIERNVCKSVTKRKWEDAVAFRKRLDALMRLIAAQK